MARLGFGMRRPAICACRTMVNSTNRDQANRFRASRNLLAGSNRHRTVQEGQMTELNPLSDKDETPEDVATLYSWANLHGAKYRDFSASRAQTREKARLRAEQAAGDEQHRAQREAEETRAAEARQAAEEARS